jgi:hypothetical protein
MEFIMKSYLVPILSALLLLGAASAHAGSGSDLLKYLPDSSKVVVSMDIEAMRGSHVLSEVFESVESEDRFNTIQQKLSEVGFSPTEQIATLVAGATSTSPDARPLIVAQGEFPRAELEEALQNEEQATAETVGDLTVFEVPDRGATVFLADNTIAVGPRELVDAAIANKDRAQPGFGTKMQQLIGAADHSRNIWMASYSPNTSRTEGTSLAQAEGVSIAMNVSSGLEMTLKILTGSAEAAQSISNDLSEQITHLKEREQIAALGLASVVEAATVTSSESFAVVQLALDENRWNRLFNTLKSIVTEQLR